jgi:DUF1680 family protein
MNLKPKITHVILFNFLIFSLTVNAQERLNIPQPKIKFKESSVYRNELPKQNTLSGYLGMRYFDNLKKRLLAIDEKGILDGFIHRPGKQVWIGEHVGKYLESAANTWIITKDPDLKKLMDRIATTLIGTQLPNGYLGTYTPDKYWTAWDVWVHKYDLYGLLAYYRVTGNQKALVASRKIGDLLCQTFGDSPGQLDIILSGTHVGMAATSILDPMADLYRWTGDSKYLDFCNYLVRSYESPKGPKIVTTLLREKQVDKVANAKAYEMLSNLVGILKLYRLTGDQKLLTASDIAFNDIVSKRLYISGTASDHEHFKNDFVLQANNEAHMGEGCVTVTWMQFNIQMFAITGELKYFDEIEKSVYNQLLAAENPQTGCVSYYTPLMGKKPYGCEINCCLSSVPRGIALLPYLNYGKINNMPSVLLYESATITDSINTLNKSGQLIQLTIKSEFPQKGVTTIGVNPTHSSKFTLQLRVPSWSSNFKATINGKMYSEVFKGWITINRKWEKGDKISVSYDIPVKVLDGGKSYPGFIALRRGPQLLSLDSSLNTSVNPDIPIVLKSDLSNIQLNNAIRSLPQNWVGKQAYSLSVETNRGVDRILTLVPFAEAGQTGAKSNVWIPFRQNK